MTTFLETPHGIVHIRPATESDADNLRTLRLEALRNHPDFFSSDYASNENQPAGYWRQRLHSLGSTSMMYFACHADDLIGMCAVYKNDSIKTQHSASIVSVYVQPAWRGLRIAESLLAACLEWARSRQTRIVKLAVVSQNTAAILLYSRCGFRIYGIEPQALYHDGVMYDEVLMAREP